MERLSYPTDLTDKKIADSRACNLYSSGRSMN